MLRSSDRSATLPPLLLPSLTQILLRPKILTSMGFIRRFLSHHHGLLKKRYDSWGRNCYWNFKIEVLVDGNSTPKQITIRAKRKKLL